MPLGETSRLRHTLPHLKSARAYLDNAAMRHAVRYIHVHAITTPTFWLHIKRRDNRTGSKRAEMAPQKIIIDTDPGFVPPTLLGAEVVFDSNMLPPKTI